MTHGCVGREDQIEEGPDIAEVKEVEATQAAVRQQVAVAGMQVLQRGAAAAAMAEVVLVMMIYGYYREI